MARLGDVFLISSGGTPDRKKICYYENGTIPWVKTGDLKEKYISKNVDKITLNGLQNSSAKIFPVGTVLVAMYGATIGNCSILNYEASTNQACAAFLPNSKVDPSYLYYFLLSQKDTFIKHGVGGAQPNISIGYLKQVPFEVKPLNEQRRIAAILDKVTNLIALRKQQLAKLDELVKARFVEMFGDESLFITEPLATNVEEMFIGPFGSSLKNECFVPVEEGYCMVYEQKHAIKKTMDVETRYVNKSKFNELQRFSVCGGDIIVSCRGTIGETFVVPETAPLGIMHPSIMKIRLKTNKYDVHFFDFLLKGILKQYENQANGTGVKMALTASMLGEKRLIVPEIAFQKKFSSFSESINKQALTIRQGLDILELLKKTVVQKYFG